MRYSEKGLQATVNSGFLFVPVGNMVCTFVTKFLVTVVDQLHFIAIGWVHSLYSLSDYLFFLLM